MLDKILDVLSKGITVRQRDFIKSLGVVFPIVYCGLDFYTMDFLSTDILTRCMRVLAVCIILNSISLVFLYVIHWLARCPMWNGLFYFAAPVIFTALDFNYPVCKSESNCAALVNGVLYHYAVFFSPFLLYALCLSVCYHITHKPDNRPNPLAPDNTNYDAKND